MTTSPTEIKKVREWLGDCKGVLAYAEIFVESGRSAIPISKTTTEGLLNLMTDSSKVYAQYSERTRVLVVGKES